MPTEPPVKRSAPPRRTKPLKRGKPLARSRKPIKAKGQRRFKAGSDPLYRAWIRCQRCYVVGTFTGESYPVAGTLRVPIDGTRSSQDWRVCQIEASHIQSKGAGGSDRENLLPLDTAIHRDQHRIGIQSWAKKHGTTLTKMREAAQAYTARYLREYPDRA